MSGPVITHMTPGVADDCDVDGCTGVSGGVCASFPESSTAWCCAPYATTCWGHTETSCDSQLNKTLIYCAVSGVPNWCCNSRLENCGEMTSDRQGCMPRNFTNPALSGPVWGPGAPPPKPKPPPQSPISPAGGAAFGLSCVFLVSAVAGVVYFFWNRNGWQMKRDQMRRDIPAVEHEDKDGVLKLPKV